MRLLITLSIFMILFIIFSAYIQNQILLTATNIREQLPQISEAINAENWQIAEEHVISLQKYWNEIQDYWDLIIVHREIEDVELLFSRLLSYIKSQEKPSALAELAALDVYFSHIYRNHMFNIQNVF
ncbi:MAG: DUF4363 family protein [Firmicutes bacterium]|nr:DUF4363 family protein [Bacillota bacterium]